MYFSNVRQRLGKFIISSLFVLMLIACDSDSDDSAESLFFLSSSPSIARQWNEVLLGAIRNDFARPTVHARNLFHMSVVMYDAWAFYDATARPYLLGLETPEFSCPLPEITARPADLNKARHEAISYAAFRLLLHRFQFSPGRVESRNEIEALFADLGYDSENKSLNFEDGPAALGNYLASCMIAWGLQDGSNEQKQYANQFYEPVNAGFDPAVPGAGDIENINRWQPLNLDVYIDQSGNLVEGETEFLGPEWGRVLPFALSQNDREVYERNNHKFTVYHDPGQPPLLATGKPVDLPKEYQWGFSLVSIWSSHLDSEDGVMIDISPASIGNVMEFPDSVEGYRDFYSTFFGGDSSQGHELNPVTRQPYTPQIVPRGDYTRVLAEFWADGPDSETPPGHWFTILNYINDNPKLVKKYQGQGQILDNLEWDVKGYFVLGGAMHDAAVTAWGIKGWYDYIRPVSAIRAMAQNGQSTAPEKINFSSQGIPLQEGYIEIVTEGDALAGQNNEHLGKIKLYTWRGPDFIDDPASDAAGVGWILAENWWPYQRPSFVTPPFAGYVSGHSTFSRAAAEVLTLLTGSEYFPGGMGEFRAEKNEFLVFEDGPSVDVTLQWATFRDASDQCSLSRIWGGIHPPADDIPGRRIGERIGIEAFSFADQYFQGLAGR